MTLSLLLNNGQLTLPKGGKLPQSTSCCCDLSPPPACYDLEDYCSLFLEIVSPQSLALKTKPARCISVFGGTSQVGEFRLALDSFHWLNVIPSSVTASSAEFLNVSASSLTTDGPPDVFGNGRAYVIGSTHSSFSGYYDTPCAHGFDIILNAGISLDLWLVFNPDRQPAPWYLLVTGFVTCETRTGLHPLYEVEGDVHYWAWEFSGEYDIQTGDCVKKPQRNCNKYGGLTRFIETPLTFTVNKDGCDLGGAFASTRLIEYYNGATADLVRSTGEAIRDAFSYTFKITSRPTCHEVPADCDVPIGNGDMTVAIATNPALPVGDPQNDRFILGTATVHQGSGPNNTTIRTEHFGAAAGDSGDPYLFLYQVKNQAGNILQEQYIELFCATDNAVSPPVSRWYVSIETLCYPNPGYGWTIDEWIGQVASYESPGSYVGINEGDPVPLGEPDLVHSAGYPFLTPGGTYCEPPAPARFTLSIGGG